MLRFCVVGTAVAKQSFRAKRNPKTGKIDGFQSERVIAWHDTVAWAAKEALHGDDPFYGALSVVIDFYLPTQRIVDLDNLAKGVLDPLTHAGVWRDDSQIVDLHLRKHFTRKRVGWLEVTVDVCDTLN
jgi:Holliday junction resolvase RusA-like endonuclease